jgi:hypothetical protein
LSGSEEGAASWGQRLQPVRLRCFDFESVGGEFVAQPSRIEQLHSMSLASAPVEFANSSKGFDIAGQGLSSFRGVHQNGTIVSGTPDPL